MNVSSNFNPERSEFSKMDTIKTWVNKKYHNDDKRMKQIQKHISFEVRENPFSLNLCFSIQNDDNEKRYFGKTFYAQPGIELECLKFINKVAESKEDMKVVEFAASYGLASWKFPYASGAKGTFYINELSSKMMNFFDALVDDRLGEEEKKTIKKIPGDCFKILDENPDLLGKVDVILVKNLEHFFNPVQHQLFLKLIADLLAPKGKAFLIAHCIIPYSKEHALMKAFLSERKMNSVYPGFLKYITTFKQSKDCQGIIGDNVSQVEIPKEDEECKTITVSKESLGKSFHPEIGKVSEFFEISQEVISMHFDPQTYMSALSKHASLKLDASYFVDRMGHRQKGFSKDSLHCAAIISKKEVLKLEEKMSNLDIK